MLEKFFANKVKSFLSDLLESADLDKNGVKDKEQILALVDRSVAVCKKAVKSVDLPKVLAAVEQISKALEVLAGAVDKAALLQHLDEIKAIASELVAFAKVLLPKGDK